MVPARAASGRPITNGRRNRGSAWRSSGERRRSSDSEIHRKRGDGGDAALPACVGHRPGINATLRGWRLLLPNGDDHLHHPMGPTSRPALLRGAGSFPSRALDGQPCTRASALRLYAVRRRTAHLHWPAFRHDGSSSGADDDGAALLDGVAARSQGDAISVDYLAPPWRRMAQDQGASDAALTSHFTQRSSNGRIKVSVTR